MAHSRHKSYADNKDEKVGVHCGRPSVLGDFLNEGSDEVW